MNITSSCGWSLPGPNKFALEKGEIHGIPDWSGPEGTFKTLSFPSWNIPWKGNFQEFHVLQVSLLPSKFLAQMFIPTFPHSMDVSMLQAHPMTPYAVMQLPKDLLEFLIALAHPHGAKLEEKLTLGIIFHLSQQDPCPLG